MFILHMMSRVFRYTYGEKQGKVLISTPDGSVSCTPFYIILPIYQSTKNVILILSVPCPKIFHTSRFTSLNSFGYHEETSTTWPFPCSHYELSIQASKSVFSESVLNISSSAPFLMFLLPRIPFNIPLAT